MPQRHITVNCTYNYERAFWNRFLKSTKARMWANYAFSIRPGHTRQETACGKSCSASSLLVLWFSLESLEYTYTRDIGHSWPASGKTERHRSGGEVGSRAHTIGKGCIEKCGNPPVLYSHILHQLPQSECSFLGRLQYVYVCWVCVVLKRVGNVRTVLTIAQHKCRLLREFHTPAKSQKASSFFVWGNVGVIC